MPEQGAPAIEDQTIAPTLDELTARSLAPASSGLHFAAPGFEERNAPTEFGAMPEVMPPPPPRPMLPPDVEPEPHKPGLIARLLGGAAK